MLSVRRALARTHTSGPFWCLRWMARAWSCGPRICAKPHDAPPPSAWRHSRHGWGAVAGSTPNEWPRWPPSIPSSALCALRKKSCPYRASRGRSRRGHGQNTNASGPASPIRLKKWSRRCSKKRRHRDPKRKKRWVALVDGNRTQIDHLFRLADERKLNMPIVVDFIHVAQYVWEAAKALIPEDQTEQDQWVRAHLLEILRGRASLVAAGIRRSATLRAMAAAERQAGANCADYLINYAPYLQYDKVLAEGLPIATGVIEGTCRHLVEDRMNLTGARWSLTGAEAVLRLRALRSSDDFDAYWQFHEQQEYKRNHAAHYANYHVPKVVSAALLSQLSRRGTLKIVKKKGES